MKPIKLLIKLSIKRLAKIGLLMSAFVGSVFIFTTAHAQSSDTFWENVDYDIQLGASKRNFRRATFEHTVTSEGAETIKLNFKGVHLGAKSYLELTSIEDDTTQILDGKSLAEANFSSAYFNGDSVRVTLHRAKGERFSRVSIDSIDVGKTDGIVAFSQCGSVDNRVPSDDPAAGRIMPVGCTGWLINNRKVLTAGHCISSSTQSLHFNIPLSTSGGRRVNPGPEDQYTIIQDSIEFRDGGPGNDWAVFEVRNNSQTNLHPVDAQGKSYTLVRDHDADTIRITGYGRDGGERNYIQQTHTGPFRGTSGTRLTYQVDTEGGNSGSAVVDESTGHAIGIHTHGGCSTSGGGANTGTSTLNNAFWQAADVNADSDVTKVGISRIQSTSTTTANRRAMPFIMPKSGFVSSITMYHLGGSGKMQLGVYADNDGLPGELLASTAEAETSANTGWQTIPLERAAAAAAGDRIWLAWAYENNPGIFYDTGTPGRANINRTWESQANNMPGNFGASTIANYRYSIYATFSEDDGGSTANVGIESIGGSSSVNGSRRAMPFEMPESGRLDSISIYHVGGSGGLILAAYADNNGVPGNLIASSGQVSVSSSEGWQTASLGGGANVGAGQSIWLAWVFENNPGIRYVSSGPGRFQSSETWSGGMPNAFGAGGQSDFRYSIYATYSK